MFSMNTSSTLYNSLSRTPRSHASHATGRSDSLRESPLLPAPPTSSCPLPWNAPRPVLVSPSGCIFCVAVAHSLPRHLGARQAKETDDFSADAC